MLNHKLRIFRAQLKRDLRTFSDMCPFVTLQSGPTTKKTLVAEGAGKKPKWNEIIQLKSNTTKVSISVYDDGSLGHELVGKGELDVGKIQPTSKEVVVDLQYEGKVIGKLFVFLLGREDRSMSLPLNIPNQDKMEEFQQTQEQTERSALKKVIAQNILTTNISGSDHNNQYQNQKKHPQPLLNTHASFAHTQKNTQFHPQPTSFTPTLHKPIHPSPQMQMPLYPPHPQHPYPQYQSPPHYHQNQFGYPPNQPHYSPQHYSPQPVPTGYGSMQGYGSVQGVGNNTINIKVKSNKKKEKNVPETGMGWLLKNL